MSKRDVTTSDCGVSIRVLIADEQPTVRRGLKALLTAMRWSTLGHAEPPVPAAGFFPIEVVGEAENGRQAVEQAGALYPDVVLMDLRPRAVPAAELALDGIATIEMIKSRWPAIRIVVVTMYATDRAAFLAAGADAFLLKGCSTSELLDAVMPGGPMRPGQ